MKFSFPRRKHSNLMHSLLMPPPASRHSSWLKYNKIQKSILNPFAYAFEHHNYKMKASVASSTQGKDTCRKLTPQQNPQVTESSLWQECRVRLNSHLQHHRGPLISFFNHYEIIKSAVLIWVKTVCIAEI